MSYLIINEWRRRRESDWDISKWMAMKDAGFISFTCSQSRHKFTFFMKQCTHPLNYEARWKKLWKAMCCEWSLNDFSTWLSFVSRRKSQNVAIYCKHIFLFVVRFCFCFFYAPWEWNAIFNRIISSRELWRSGLRLQPRTMAKEQTFRSVTCPSSTYC